MEKVYAQARACGHGLFYRLFHVASEAILKGGPGESLCSHVGCEECARAAERGWPLATEVGAEADEAEAGAAEPAARAEAAGQVPETRAALMEQLSAASRRAEAGREIEAQLMAAHRRTDSSTNT